MTQYKVWKRKIISANGNTIAEAYSTAVTASHGSGQVQQSVSVSIKDNGRTVSSSSSSSSKNISR